MLGRIGWQEIAAQTEIRARSRVWPWRRMGLCDASGGGAVGGLQPAF